MGAYDARIWYGMDPNNLHRMILKLQELPKPSVEYFTT